MANPIIFRQIHPIKQKPQNPGPGLTHGFTLIIGRCLKEAFLLKTGESGFYFKKLFMILSCFSADRLYKFSSLKLRQGIVLTSKLKDGAFTPFIVALPQVIQILVIVALPKAVKS